MISKRSNFNKKEKRFFGCFRIFFSKSMDAPNFLFISKGPASSCVSKGLEPFVRERRKKEILLYFF